MAGRSAIAIELSETERAELASRLRRRKVGRGDAMRAQIVLLAAEGLSNVAIAARFGTTRVTVATWRRRFAAQRLEGLLDEPRPGAPRTVSDEKVAEVVTATLESLPVGRTHWSSRSMAQLEQLARNMARTFSVIRCFCLGSFRGLSKCSENIFAVDRCFC